MKVALLRDAKACGVGLAYSRVTDPAPTVSLFDHVLTGHGRREAGSVFLEDLLRRTEAALEKP